jgi:aspartate-semialdehyde dehydrogenase
LGVSAQCCRVAVAVGHYENAWITFERPVSVDALAAVLQDAQRAPFVRYLPGAAGEGLSALSCVQHRDRALVGRLRLDARDDSKRTMCMTVVGDNLRLGAATNAVRVASRWFAASDPDLQTR